MTRRAHRRDERGVATALALGMTVLLVISAVVAIGLVRVVAARHAAAAAADLGALAGAAAFAAGTDPCTAAARVVAANGAGLVQCATEGADVLVAAQVRTAPLLGSSWAPAARARAGPAP